MATSSICIGINTNSGTNNGVDGVKTLYPIVNEEETPLPRSWSSRDKYSFIGLSQSNLRVHYKGYGKSHKDAASVRATHPIPPACGLYYYEVKIVSKGRDGYMGIGLSAQGVNMNRLPGWDKNSYGYHGDDGHSFCSSGTGQPYGPTFTTGDVIGCGINLIDNICFYTKNGNYLGVAFTDLPPNLYPTVGLQTPGEVVDANFGQSPFVFDIHEMRKELKNREVATIRNFPVGDTYGEWQTMLHRMVSTYLVHHGYCATAEAFARSSSQDLEEELTSIRNRQKIQKLVLSGKMGDAIRLVKELYPSLLDKNGNLLFILKVRQFIEMVNGSDSDVDPSFNKVPLEGESMSSAAVNESSSEPSSPPASSRRIGSPSWANGQANEETCRISQHTSVIQSTKDVVSSMNNSPPSSLSLSTEDMNQRNAQEYGNNTLIYTGDSDGSSTANGSAPVDIPPPPPLITSLSSNSSPNSRTNDSDIEMECSDGSPRAKEDESSRGFTNGFAKHKSSHFDDEEEMEVESHPTRAMCGGDPATIERMLTLGRELQKMSQSLRRELGKNNQNKMMLQDAFSLLAYNDPWSSPVGWQLDPIQREPVCQALNSAILESHQLPRRPPLEICVSHTRQLIDLMSKSGLGSCAFASVEAVLQRHLGNESTSNETESRVNNNNETSPTSCPESCDATGRGEQ